MVKRRGPRRTGKISDWKPGGWRFGFRYYRIGCLLAQGPAPAPAPPPSPPNVYFGVLPCGRGNRRGARVAAQILPLGRRQDSGCRFRVRWAQFFETFSVYRLASNNIRPLHRHQQPDTPSVSEAPSQGANTHDFLIKRRCSKKNHYRQHLHFI